MFISAWSMHTSALRIRTRVMVVVFFFVCASGVASSQEQDFGTANLHMEVSDIVSVLVYVGVAKGNGVLSKTGWSFSYLRPFFRFKQHRLN